MPFVVVDTNVSLRATLSPRGVRRKFWILLALGALRYDIDHRELDLEELITQATEGGGEVGGEVGLRQGVLDAEVRLAALAEHLPYGTPEDWVAVGSAHLFNEYERKVKEVGVKMNPEVRIEDAERLRRQVMAVCPVACSPFHLDNCPEFTPDRDDDPIVFTALRGGADFLISNDKDIVPNNHSRPYEYKDNAVLALTFETLMEEHLRPLDISWDAIDGQTLAQAYRQLLDQAD